MWRNALYSNLTAAVADMLRGLQAREAADVTEIRFYLGRPAELTIGTRTVDKPVVLDAEGMDALVAALCGYARYAYEREMAMGYIPLAGGHRAGICGRQTADERGELHMGGVTSVCLRIARPVPGASEGIRPHLIDGRRARRVLIIGPPGCGKTTVLRDAAAYLSDEAGLHVAAADERDELFPAGWPGARGRRIDVMSGMDKARMMTLMLRTMAPQAIVTDEIGKPEDAQAICDIARCGVGLLASAHGDGIGDMQRPTLRALLDARALDRVAVMERWGCFRVYDRDGCELGRRMRSAQIIG